jgi:hypothetical protein
MTHIFRLAMAGCFAFSLATLAYLIARSAGVSPETLKEVTDAFFIGSFGTAAYAVGHLTGATDLQDRQAEDRKSRL